jgi:LAGLIDADG endonuclease
VLASDASNSLTSLINNSSQLEYSKEEFYSWLAGFSEAEGCFKIKPKYREGKKTVHSFYFEFEIHLHIDDQNLLNHICATLGVGRVYLREKSKSCSFIVGNEAGIRGLLTIFDNHQFNGIKYLDYQDFKKAFLLYFDRPGILNDDLINKIIKLQNGLNTGRTNFIMPSDHTVKITPYWLLGLIEGEGSFSLSRYPLRPLFQLLFTVAQEPLLLKVKEFLVENLGFDHFSNWQLVNSAVIGLSLMKAKGNSKPTVSLGIRDINVLHNYLLPFLSKMKFFSKKELDFNDFKVICQTSLQRGT